MLRRPCRRIDGERGAVLVLVAPIMVALLAITALVVDMGNARQESRQAQASADAAALAGARELPVMAPVGDAPFSAVRSRAVEFAGKNQTAGSIAFTATACPSGEPLVAKCFNAGETTLKVITPYTGGGATGPKAYNLIYVEICQPTQTFFSQVIGMSSPTVCRDAVGRRQNTAGGFGMGLVVIDPSACSALSFSGNSETVLSSNGAVMVNSACPNAALDANGMSWEVVTSYIGVVGGANLAPCAPPSTCTATQPTPIIPFENPLGHIVPPAEPAVSGTHSCAPPSGTRVMEPGTYPTSCTFNSADGYIFRPGTYYFKNGFSTSGGGALVCSNTATSFPLPADSVCDGVTFVAAGGAISMNGNSSVFLPPPTDPENPLAGISIYQISDADSSINGTSDFVLGTIYAPNAYYKFTGSSGGGSKYINIYGMVVTKTADISGTFTFRIEVPDGSPEALLEDDFGLWE